LSESVRRCGLRRWGGRIARLTALQAALAVVAGVALLALFFTGGIPKDQPRSAPSEEEFAAALALVLD